MGTRSLDGIGMTSRRTRQRLVKRLRQQGIGNEKVLQVIAELPRHLFLDEALASRAYEDIALPIGCSQTISQPYIVAKMTETLLGDGGCRRVLEIGTGSGYQTAVLARLVDEVYTVERLEPLMKQAVSRMCRLRFGNIHYRHNDGIGGWLEHAPFDGILVTAAPVEVPAALLEQLAPDGRLVIPVGGGEEQELLLIARNGAGFLRRRLELVNFVPLIGGKG